MTEENYDYLYKIVVIGDSGVGKTNLIARYTVDGFTLDSKATIGVEFGHAIVKQADGSIIKLQIWDTAGQERYRSVTHGYYRGTSGVIIVFDITKMETFKNVHKWLTELRDFVFEDIPIILIGNKIDLTSFREVSTESAVTFAKYHYISYMETSALSGENVQRALNSLVDNIHETHITKLRKQQEARTEAVPTGDKIVVEEKIKKSRLRSCC